MRTSTNAVSARPTVKDGRLHQPVFDMAPFSLPSSFWKPSHRRGSPWLEHLPFCSWAIEAGRPASVVVTGTTDGVPYFALCEAVQRLGLQTQCLAILRDKSPPTELVVWNEDHFGEFSQITVADGVDATALAPTGIDLLVLADYDPEEDGALERQWDAWLPKLSRRAVVLVPRVESEQPGVWSRIRKEHPHLTFHHSEGLGVAGVGEALPELFHHLLNLKNSRHAGLVRAMFARLGTAVGESHRHALAKRRRQQAEARAGNLKSELLAASSSLEAAGRLQDAIQQDLQRTIELRQQAETGRKALEDELRASSRKLELHAQHAERVAAAIEQLKQGHSADRTQLSRARRRASRAEAEARRVAEHAQVELERARKKLQGVKGEAAGLRKKLKRERKLHQQVQRDLEMTLGSRSWALTAPLRKMARWVKG